ncbi:MAG: DUF1700 domain-containing protein [Candidatus Izemoplasmatales bacterium]
MNKQDFLNNLRIELNKNNVQDIDDIMSDFEEHFANRIEEGIKEDDISRKIGLPEDIAKDYAKQSLPEKNPSKGWIRFGLVFIDFFAILLLVTVFLSFIVLAAFTVSLFVLGLFLVIGANISNLIPTMPYVSGLLIGISMISLSVFSGIGTMTIYLYIRQWVRAYSRWHKNKLVGNIYPSLSKHPKVSKRKSSILKLINIYSIILFISTFTIGYIVSALLANSFEFWHVWHWFV